MTLPALQRDLGDSIAAFYAATEEMGVAQDVTTFTAADFGRTLTVNGDGTDHGWGSHHFVVGGGVNGGDIYGDIPVAELGHAQDAGNGRLIPDAVGRSVRRAPGALVRPRRNGTGGGPARARGFFRGAARVYLKQ